MRIALITDGLKTGGAEGQCVVAARELARRGHHVMLISYSARNDYAAWLSDSAAEYVQVRRRGLLRIARLLQIRRLLQRGRIEVAHCFKEPSSVWGRMAAKLAAVPCIFAGARGLTRQGRISGWLNRRLTAGTAGWIVNSGAIRDYLVSTHRFQPDIVHVVPNGLDLQGVRAVDRDDARRRLGLAPGVPVVAVVANLRAVKNHAMVLRAARRLKDQGIETVFLLAGEGPLRDELQSMAKELDVADTVSFLGHRDDVWDILCASDIAALASHSEGLPNCLLEAAAAGQPAVSTANGGSADVIVDGETGFLVGLDDDEAMAEKLARLLNDEHLRRRMGLAARERVLKEFSVEKYGDRLIRTYRRCLRPAGCAGEGGSG